MALRDVIMRIYDESRKTEEDLEYKKPDMPKFMVVPFVASGSGGPYIPEYNSFVVANVFKPKRIMSCVIMVTNSVFNDPECFPSHCAILYAANCAASTFIVYIRDIVEKNTQSGTMMGNFGESLLDYITSLEIAEMYNRSYRFLRKETQIIYRLIERANKNNKIENVFNGMFQYTFDKNLDAKGAREILANAFDLDEDIIRKFEDSQGMTDMVNAYLSIQKN